MIRLRQIPLEGEDDSFSRDSKAENEISPTLQVNRVLNY